MNGVATVVMPPRLQAQAARARLSRGLPARMGSSAPIMNGAPQSSPAGSASRSLGRLPPRAAGTTRLAGTVCAQQRGSSWAAPAAPATSTSTALSGCQQRRWRLPGRQPGPALVRGSALLPLPRQQRRDMRARSAEVEGIRLVGLDVMTFLGTFLPRCELRCARPASFGRCCWRRSSAPLAGSSHVRTARRALLYAPLRSFTLLSPPSSFTLLRT